MGLTCSCDGGDREPGEVVWEETDTYVSLATKRGRLCCSCKEKLTPGDTCVEITRFKVPEFEIEERIYGEESGPPRASKWMCERCADLMFSLTELGYCAQPWDDQRELVADYADMHAPIVTPNAGVTSATHNELNEG